MRCIGRTKSLKRCKRKCRILFCNLHKLQWWGVIVIVATLGGLFQDVIKPLFKQKKNQTEELVNLLIHRKSILDTLYVQINTEINTLPRISYNTDSSEIWRTYLKDYKLRLEKAKNELDVLHRKSINALKNDQLILSHELGSRIHQISRKYRLDEFDNIVTPENIELLKALILKTERFAQGVCESDPHACLQIRDNISEHTKEFIIKNMILKFYGKEIDTHSINFILENY